MYVLLLVFYFMLYLKNIRLRGNKNETLNVKGPHEKEQFVCPLRRYLFILSFHFKFCVFTCPTLIENVLKSFL